MIRLCIKLLSTGSAMMWEGGSETTREREKERGGGKKRGGEGGSEAANGSFCDIRRGREGETERREGGRE